MLLNLASFIFIILCINIGLSCYLFMKIYTFSEHPLMWSFSLLGAGALVYFPLAYVFSDLYDKIIEIIKDM